MRGRIFSHLDYLFLNLKVSKLNKKYKSQIKINDLMVKEIRLSRLPFRHIHSKNTHHYKNLNYSKNYPHLKYFTANNNTIKVGTSKHELLKIFVLELQHEFKTQNKRIGRVSC